jgi:glycosyltransferase involved in cell wall biosynthesis
MSTSKHPFDPQNYPESVRSKVNTLEHVSIDTSVKPAQVIKHLFNRRSYNIARFDSPKLHDKLKFLLKQETYTHIILDSLYVCPYIETIRGNSNARIIVRTHNVEHLIWKTLAYNLPKSIKRWYLARLAEDLKRYELAILNKADSIFTITEEDAQKLKSSGIQIPISVIPVAMETVMDSSEHSLHAICFLGAMNWKPNIEAVQLLYKSIFPSLRKEIPDLEFHLAGSFMDSNFPSEETNGFFNHGYVEDSNEFLKTHGILVLPILSGSGVRMKLLEAMALGLAIVTTHQGAMGVNAIDSFVLADDTEDIILKTKELLASPGKRKEMGSKAQNYIQEHYSVSEISKLIDAKLHGI